MSDQKIYIVVKSTYKDLENLDVALVNRENICAFTDGDAALEYIKQKAETTHPNVTFTGRCTGKSWVENGVTMYETLWVDTIDLADERSKASSSNGADCTREAFKVVHGMATGKIGAREWLMIAYRGVELTANDIFTISGIPVIEATKLLESGKISHLKTKKKCTNIIRLLMYLGPEYDKHMLHYAYEVRQRMERGWGVELPIKGLTSSVSEMPKIGTVLEHNAMSTFDPVMCTWGPSENCVVKFYRTSELAKILGVGTSTIDYWVTNGLKFTKVESERGPVRIMDERDIAAFLNSEKRADYRRKWNMYVAKTYGGKKGGEDV